MSPFIIASLSIGCYLVSTLLLAIDTFRGKVHYQSIIPGWVAVIVHVTYITVVSLQQSNIDFGIFSIGSIIASIIALFLLLVNLNTAIDKLGVAIFPVAALTLFLTLYYPNTEQVFHQYSWQMNTHILSSIIAFSLLNIAALQAIFLAIQEHQLRKRPPGKLILILPSLQTMETLLFKMISTGILFLTISLLSGFVFIDDLFAQHLAHKTVLSILAWVIFTSLLFGRTRYGWRGQTAIQWTLVGFTSLLLAYFGSKMVLELILI